MEKLHKTKHCVLINVLVFLSLQGSFVLTATVEPRFCPSDNRTEEVFEQVINAPAPQSLIDHTDEFVPPQHIEV